MAGTCICAVAMSGVAPQTGSGQIFAPGTTGQFDTAVVSVLGKGQAFVSPSRATVFIQIVTRDESPEAATFRNGEIRNEVTEMLLSLGYGEQEISLWGYGAAPLPERGFGGPPMAAGTSSHEAKSGLRVVVEPVERLDAVVSSVLMAGASVSTVLLESDELQAARRDAAKEAVTQARIEAEAMAEAAGGRLGDLLSVTTVPDYMSGTNASMQWSVYPGGPGGEGVHLTPNDLTIRVTVQVTWAFRAR